MISSVCNLVISLVVNFGYFAIFKKKLGKPCIFSVKCVLKTKIHHFCESFRNLLLLLLFGRFYKLSITKSLKMHGVNHVDSFEQIHVNYCKY